MRSTRSLDITLPLELADMVQSKVRSGEYASESDVVLEGLHALAARDAALETWLLDEVLPTYDAAMADPARVLSADEAWAKLRQHMEDHAARAPRDE